MPRHPRETPDDAITESDAVEPQPVNATQVESFVPTAAEIAAAIEYLRKEDAAQAAKTPAAPATAEMQFGENVTLINRTPVELRCQWDGAHYRFKPGKNHGVPLAIARAACQQNPLMGSEHPYDPMSYESLCGIEGSRGQFAAVTPLRQSTAKERIDRGKMVGPGSDATPMDAGGPTYFEAMAGVGNADTSADTLRPV
jgi:hypothetical protein